MKLRFSQIKMIIIYLFIILSGCNKSLKTNVEKLQLELFEEDYLYNFRKSYGIIHINEYEEAYRLYTIPALQRPEIFTIFKMDNIWYFSYGKIEKIIGIKTVFEENDDITVIFNTTNFILGDSIINSFLKNIEKLYILPGYENLEYLDLNMYYFEYTKGNEINIIKFMNDRSNETKIYNEIIKEFKKLIE